MFMVGEREREREREREKERERERKREKEKERERVNNKERIPLDHSPANKKEMRKRK